MIFGGCPLHWVSKIHTDISLSTLESEYIALSQAIRDLLHLRQLLQEVVTQLNMEFSSPAIIHSTVFEKKNGALVLNTSSSKTPRTRHILWIITSSDNMLVTGKGL